MQHWQTARAVAQGAVEEAGRWNALLWTLQHWRHPGSAALLAAAVLLA